MYAMEDNVEQWKQKGHVLYFSVLDEDMAFMTIDSNDKGHDRIERNACGSSVSNDQDCGFIYYYYYYF